MNSQESTRAVLFFTRAPLSEARHKRFHGISLEKQARLYEAFIEHFSNEVCKSDLPLVYAVDEPQFFESRISLQNLLLQTGDSFSERLTNAIDDAFALGYEELIIIGNDAPAICATHFQTAVDALLEADLALGESADGGAYLIALKKATWRSLREDFKTIRWLSSLVFTDFRHIAVDQNLSVFFLQRLSELDSLHDAPMVFSEISSEKIFNALAATLQPLSRIFIASSSVICEASQINRLRFQKAPPFLA